MVGLSEVQRKYGLNEEVIRDFQDPVRSQLPVAVKGDVEHRLHDACHVGCLFVEMLQDIGIDDKVAQVLQIQQRVLVLFDTTECLEDSRSVRYQFFWFEVVKVRDADKGFFCCEQKELSVSGVPRM